MHASKSIDDDGFVATAVVSAIGWWSFVTDTGYEIAYFRPEHEAQVLELLKDLWKYDLDTRARLFRWKHLENPHADGPLGIVALHNAKVVGFRGYFADRFVLDGHHDNIGILHPGDTCVDPGHQNKGLSVAMGNLAMRYDASRYRFFLNMTCSKNSLPGYLKMGFQPLAKRVHLVQHGRNPLRWLVENSKKAPIVRPLAASRIRFGQFGNILVTDSPLPAEMASIIEAQGHANAVLRLHQDQAFFAWRYRNPVQKYVFYLLLDGNAARAFVAMEVSANNLAGEILDYGARDDPAMREILNYISRSRHFMTLSVLSYGVDARLRKALAGLGFAAFRPWKALLKKGSAEELAFPLLIRPLARSLTEQSFMIEGLDVRKIASWHLKPICSDAA